MRWIAILALAALSACATTVTDEEFDAYIDDRSFTVQYQGKSYKAFYIETSDLLAVNRDMGYSQQELVTALEEGRQLYFDPITAAEGIGVARVFQQQTGRTNCQITGAQVVPEGTAVNVSLVCP